MGHPLACRCGAVRGLVEEHAPTSRTLCYCADCQAYAHFLGRAGDVLNAQGGTDVIQTTPDRMTLTAGADRLGCVTITARGPLRWYATCCNTPIANTAPSAKVAFVGLVSTCLKAEGRRLDESFGPPRMRVFTDGAKGEPKPKASPFLPLLLRIVGRSLKARLDGSWRRTPFFDVAADRPVAEPMVLTPDERARLVAAAAEAA
jgi:hypothetical protein